METLILTVFLIGYFFMAIEHVIEVNKAAISLITGILCWTIYIILYHEHHQVVEHLLHHIGEISGILFFLLGAMTIVEIIDAHSGFEIITNRIKFKNKRTLLISVSLLSFFLSALLDNLTTAIVMVTLLRKLLSDANDRKIFLGMVIIASNAGGAWSPIGDVTTTMLWIGEQLTSETVIFRVFIPALICLLVPLFLLSFRIRGEISKNSFSEYSHHAASPKETRYVLFMSMAILVFVPLFKTITHLPPYMGMLLGLSVLWIITDVMHKRKQEEEKSYFSVSYAIRKTDVPSILFFLGILLSISALQSTGQLHSLAMFLHKNLPNENLIVLSIGLLSALVDNVPMVAGAMGMYDLATFPTDHTFWTFLAYSAGTGGSSLIIGSAAGVAVMGMEKISFGWYLKNIALYALIGFFSGAGVYLLQMWLVS
ncbi:MAG: sodium:proton antiporter NhaD [Cytophagaceae bacterium]|nr:sodium:proton antiporter NhaD [Cytophagaceae bacterium]